MEISIKNRKIFLKFINEKKELKKRPLLVFLHEGLGSVEQWKDFPEFLCKKCNLQGLVYDRYGYGKSSELQEKRTVYYLHEEADFLQEFLAELNVDVPVILFGHSDGGTIALLYASKYPQSVEYVVTEAHHVLIEKQSLDGIKKAVEAYEKGRLKSALQRFHGNKVDAMFYGWASTWLEAGTENYFLFDELKKITCPVLAIQGENDRYGTYAQMQAIDDYCKNSKILWLKNCGHVPHYEYKDLVARKVVGFLSL